jgi:hypothetical protein
LISRYKSIFSSGIKIAIVVFALWFIYKKLVTNNNLRDFNDIISGIPKSEIIAVISVVLLLMLVNWGLEALKWRMLLRQIEKLSV